MFLAIHFITQKETLINLTGELVLQCYLQSQQECLYQTSHLLNMCLLSEGAQFSCLYIGVLCHLLCPRISHSASRHWSKIKIDVSDSVPYLSMSHACVTKFLYLKQYSQCNLQRCSAGFHICVRLCQKSRSQVAQQNVLRSWTKNPPFLKKQYCHTYIEF